MLNQDILKRDMLNSLAAINSSHSMMISNTTKDMTRDTMKEDMIRAMIRATDNSMIKDNMKRLDILTV